MAKKRVKRRAKRSSVAKSVSSQMNYGDRRVDLVTHRLIFFLVLFVIFLVLDFATRGSNSLWNDFFNLGFWVFAFISVSLFVVLLVLWFMKLMKKR